MHPFDDSLTLEALGERRYGGSLDGRWWIDLGPNGGFLASLMLAALSREVDPARHPLSLSVHYPGRARIGAVEFEVVVEREGRSMTFVTGRMYQDGQVLSTAQASFTSPRASGAFDHIGIPDVTPAEEAPVIELPPEMIPRFSRNFEYRPVLGAFPYSGADRALVGAWIRPAEPRAVDALLVATYADALFPASFTMAPKAFPIPTMDLTVHFRAPVPRAGARDEWCLARFESRYAGAGYIEEDGCIWAADGTLLAQSRQLAIFGTQHSKEISYEVPS